jgi:hypothetical protein
MSTRYLTPPELSGVLSVPVARLAQWRIAGIGPRFCKAGRLVRYSEAAVTEWLRASERTSTAEPAVATP